MAGKKGAKSKKSKSSTDKSSINTSDASSTKPSDVDPYALDPSFHRGSSKFTFPNGDTYEGEFCAHLSGLVWREGKGTYTTADGQVYTGRWESDKLVENQDIEILYPDGTKYFGKIYKNKYSGPGVCELEENVSLVCDFIENKPSGEITLVDPNEKVWHGVAEKNDALLLPEHAFYKNIHKDRGKSRALQEHLPDMNRTSQENFKNSQEILDGETQDVDDSKKYSDWRWLEEQIFAKTTITDDTTATDFANSQWYQDYAKFRDKYGPVVLKVKQTGEESLNYEEKTWFIKYKEFEQNYSKIMQKIRAKKFKQSESVENLFHLIHSEEYKKRNQPMPVFYPSKEDSDSINKFCDSCENVSCYGE